MHIIFKAVTTEGNGWVSLCTQLRSNYVRLQKQVCLVTTEGNRWVNLCMQLRSNYDFNHAQNQLEDSKYVITEGNYTAIIGYFLNTSICRLVA